MTYPAGVTTITVTAVDQQALDGTPLNGVYIFTPSAPVYVHGVAVLEGSATLTVVNGVGTPIVIPCTDTVTPAFTYTITQRLDTPDGTNPAPLAGVSVPHTLGTRVDVSTLL